MGEVSAYRKPELLTDGHDLTDFDCGRPELDFFLASVAMRSQRDGHARTFVITTKEGLVAGYYALCAGVIERALVPRQIGGHGAPRAIPVALLARLAVDKHHQGRQIGTVLLRHAFASVMSASATVAFRAIMVHPLDESAAIFYAKFGFRSVQGLERTMLLSIQDAARIISDAAMPR